MAESATGVAGLLTAAIATAAAAESTSVAATLRAVPSDVTNSTTLVALLTASGTVIFGRLRAFARDVTDTAATIAGLLLRRYSAFTADVSLSYNYKTRSDEINSLAVTRGMVIESKGAETAYHRSYSK
jgi:hypothetical protein